MRITDGHLDAYTKAVEDAVRFVEQHGPQLMVHAFVDHAAMLAYSFQLYADSNAIRQHWAISDPHIQQVMGHCEVVALDVYGCPDDDIANLPNPDSGITVQIVPHLTGFLRTGDSLPGRDIEVAGDPSGRGVGGVTSMVGRAPPRSTL